MNQCPFCNEIYTDDEKNCYICNYELITYPPYHLIQEYCKNKNLNFEQYYEVYKELPVGWVNAVPNDFYRFTKTTQKVYEGREFIIQNINTGYYEKYTVRNTTNIRSLVPYFKLKTVFIKTK